MSSGERMNRRKFISVTLWSSVGWAINPLSATVTTDPWKAQEPEDVIAALYGKDAKLVESNRVKIKAPKRVENSCSVPIKISSDIDAKRVIVLNAGNPTSLTGIFEIPKDELIDYSFRIKLKQTCMLAVVIEDVHGVLYKNHFEIDVAISGGCGG